MAGIRSESLQGIFVFVLFLVSYAIVAILGIVVFRKWDSPLHFLVPVPAFFLAYWLFQEAESEFFIKPRSLIWPVAIIVIGFLAFFVAQFLYWCNGYTNISAENTSCSSAGARTALNYIGGGWVDLLLRDGFFYFWLMILLAWISLRVVSLAAPKQSKKKAKSHSL